MCRVKKRGGIKRGERKRKKKGGKLNKRVLTRFNPIYSHPQINIYFLESDP
jgi:hypothetical protein